MCIRDRTTTVSKDELTASGASATVGFGNGDLKFRVPTGADNLVYTFEASEDTEKPAAGWKLSLIHIYGIRIYSTAQIAAKLLDLCTAESREQALKAPLDVDLTGGLGSEPIDIKALRAEAMADAEKEAAAASSQETDGSVAGKSTGLSDSSRGQQIKALPTPIVTKQMCIRDRVPAPVAATWPSCPPPPCRTSRKPTS